jgi:two-component system, OmpR family, phosphate regulon sensor histidine kinase PhoR
VVWLLTLVVLLPTAFVLWFMTQAMQNERLAVQQKLVEVYQGQLTVLRDQLDGYWARRVERLAELAQTMPASRVFAECVDSDLADSLIVFDEEGERAYPRASRTVAVEDNTEAGAWAQASRLERQPDGLLAAAQAYAGIAERAMDVNQAARALVAQARCLTRGGQTDAALEILTQTLAGDGFQHAVDTQGRLIVADAELRALQVMGGPGHSDFEATARRLRSRLLNYADPVMPSAQRRFLMNQWRALVPDGPEFTNLQAEQLAARWVESDAPPDTSTSTGLYPSVLPDIWELHAADGRVLALYRTEGLRRRIRDLVAVKALPADVVVEILAPGQEPNGGSPVVSVAGARMPGWRLSLSNNDRSLFDASAEKQIAAYFWTGVLVIAATLALAVLIAWAVRRQIRVARLKNDLVATVSHELKTPLASMRLLIDTLLDADEPDPKRVREYLHLIGRENTRLSRLIENFLTFSRLEQNRYAFKPTDIRPLDIVDAAAAAVRDRFQSSGCRFDIEAAPGLPMIVGDSDSLVTAVVNLLDNAYKYSNEDKHIVLRAFAEGGCMCFQVKDNGIGISRGGSRRVFGRFYQVDQNLSGVGSGVGLGLSIVRAIVLAHGGTVGLESEIDQGSTFTIKIPAQSGCAGTTQCEARPNVS